MRTMNELEERISKLTNPNHARDIKQVNTKKRIALNLLKQFAHLVTSEDKEEINKYILGCNFKEIELILTDAKNEIATNILLSEKEKIKLKGEAMEKYQSRYKELIGEESQKENQTTSKEQIKLIEEEFKANPNEDSNKTTGEEYEKLLENIYIKGLHKKPEYKPPLVTFKNQRFLTFKNLSVLVAGAGVGKSSICESILASMLNPECDSLGFKVQESVERAIFIDCERDYDLVDECTERMQRRANNQDKERRCLIAGVRECFTIKSKKEKITALVEYFKPQLLLIDGVGDLVHAPNNEEETANIYIWLIQLITKYEISIITTIHPNSTSTKARGHLGSEMIRRAYGLLYVSENIDKTVKTISTHKARASSPVKLSFTWSKEEKNNVTCEDITTGAIKKPPLYQCLTRDEIKKMKESYLIGEDLYIKFNYKDFVTELKKYIGEEHPQLNAGDSAIKILVSDLVKYDYVLKTGKAPKTAYTFAPNSKDKLRDEK